MCAGQSTKCCKSSSLDLHSRNNHRQTHLLQLQGGLISPTLCHIEVITMLVGMLAAALAVAPMAAMAQGSAGSATDGYTLPTANFEAGSAAECPTTMAGCTGIFVTISHGVAGEVTVIDDCTFRVQSWEFDGQGPAVEWWAAQQEGSPSTFPYPANAIKIAELRDNGNYVAGVCARSGACSLLATSRCDPTGTVKLIS